MGWKRWGLAAVAIPMAVLGGVTIAQTPLSIASPGGKPTFTADAVIPVRWSGGPPGGVVKVQLIDLTAWRVIADGAPQPNTGAVSYRLPSNLPCGRNYQFYVEDVPRTQWTYGGDFTLACGSAAPGAVRPAPTPQPAPTQPPTAGQRLCGTIHNETYNVSETVEIVLAPGRPFEGSLNIGAKLFGSGAFRGTRQGMTCQGSTAELQFQGTCTGERFSGRYTIRGQVGRMDVSANACPAGRR